MYQINKFINVTANYFQDLMGSTAPNFSLPNLQRNYKWGDKVIRKLWEDLADYRRINNLIPDKATTFDYYLGSSEFNETAPYLLGTIWVTDGKDDDGKIVRILIDGQQRLTTLSLSIMVLNEVYQLIKRDSEIKKELDQYDSRLSETGKQTIGELFDEALNLLITRNTPKLLYPQASNNEFWKKLCKVKTGDYKPIFEGRDPNSETQENMHRAFTTIREEISCVLNAEAEDGGYKTVCFKKSKWNLKELRVLSKEGDSLRCEKAFNGLAGLLATITQCIALVQFQCPPSQQVSMFDIINNRGECFDMPDMVRLMLFSTLDSNKHEELSDIWANHQIDKDVLPYVWNAFYGRGSNVAKNKLHFQIDNLLKDLSPSEKTKWILTFAGRCASASKLKVGIDKFSAVLFSDPNFDKIAFLTVTAYHKFSFPIFFTIESLGEGYAPLNQQLYRLFLNFITRLTIVSEKGYKKVGNNLSKLAAFLCEDILREKDSPSQLLETIVTRLLSEFPEVKDTNFREKFLTFSVGSSQSKFGYFVIGSLETESRGNHSSVDLKYYARTTNNDSNNLEHIYPQSPNDRDWPDASGYEKSVRERFTGLFGNLLPINQKINSAAKNKGINEKMALYRDSGLSLVKDLEDLVYLNSPDRKNGTWNKEKIEHRTEQLADKALKVFSLATNQKL